MAGEDDLVCFGESTDVDGDTLSYTYTWSSDGASIGGDTVPAGDTSGGETWTCTEVSDGTDSANASNQFMSIAIPYCCLMISTMVTSPTIQRGMRSTMMMPQVPSLSSTMK